MGRMGGQGRQSWACIRRPMARLDYSRRSSYRPNPKFDRRHQERPVWKTTHCIGLESGRAGSDGITSMSCVISIPRFRRWRIELSVVSTQLRFIPRSAV